MEDENELYGLESDYLPEEEYTEDEESQSGLSAVPSVGGLRSELFKRLLEREKAASESEKQDFNTVLSTIEQAKQRLLAQPSKGEELRNIAMRLTQPRKESDPRFYERRNLYTFLRDIGEYGGEQAEARKEAEAKALQLDQLAAKYRMERAQKEGSQARQLMAQYFREPTQARDSRTTDEKNAASMGMTLEEYLNFKADLIKKSRPEKAEPDPNRPSSVVQARVASVRDRKLAPISAKLASVSQAQSLLKAAKEGSPTASKQLDRFLAGLQGDKQLSVLEVNTIANAGSFPTRVVNSISNFLSGIPSDLSLEDKEKVLLVIEDLLAPQYNSGRESVLDTFSGSSDISQEAVERIVGRKWLTSSEKQRIAAQKKRAEDEAKANKKSTGITLSTGKAGRQTN